MTPLDDRSNMEIAQRATLIRSARHWVWQYMQGKDRVPVSDMGRELRAAIRSVIYRRGIRMPAGL